MPKTDEEIRRSLQEMVNGFSGIENPEEILKKADWFDLAAGVHNLNLTRQILGELLHREIPKPPTLPAQDPAAPEPPADTAGPSRQDVIQTSIEFYDTKTRARRLLLIADNTDNHEFVCFTRSSEHSPGRVNSVGKRILYSYDANGDLVYMTLNGTIYYYERNGQDDIIGAFHNWNELTAI